MIIPILSILLLSVGDRLRGWGKPFTKPAGYILLSAGFYCMNELYYIPLLVVLSFALGWGEPLGAWFNKIPMNPKNSEFWQVGNTLKQNTLLAVITRGALMGVPLILVSPYLLPICIIAFTISPLIANKFSGFDTWALMELIRGALIGALYFLIIQYAPVIVIDGWSTNFIMELL